MKFIVLITLFFLYIISIYLIFFKFYSRMEKSTRNKKILSVVFMISFAVISLLIFLFYYFTKRSTPLTMIIDLSIVIISWSGLMLTLFLFKLRGPRVFVSYQHKDIDLVNKFSELLMESGVEVLLVPYERREQDATVLLCVQTLEKSDICLFISREAISRWQTAEWFASVYGNKLIVILSLSEQHSARPRTSITGYPVCDVNHVMNCPEEFTSFLRGLHGSWLEMSSYCYEQVMKQIIGMIIAMKIVQYISDPIFLLINLIISEHILIQIMIWTGYIMFIILFGTMYLLLTSKLLVSIIKVHLAQAKLSKENRTRSTNYKSIKELTEYLPNSSVIQSFLLRPGVVRSELTAKKAETVAT